MQIDLKWCGWPINGRKTFYVVTKGGYKIIPGNIYFFMPARGTSLLHIFPYDDKILHEKQQKMEEWGRYEVF